MSWKIFIQQQFGTLNYCVKCSKKKDKDQKQKKGKKSKKKDDKKEDKVTEVLVHIYLKKSVHVS